MLNLIKKDFIVSIKGYGKSNLKYLFIFLFMYLFMNTQSYYITPILISYIILANTFNNDYKNKNMNYINSMPSSKEDIVYSKYMLAVILIIGVIIITSILNLLLSTIFHRQNVLNDSYYALVIFTIIVSVIFPMYFKFGYHNVRIGAGVISILIFYIVFIPMNILSNFLYLASLPENVAYGTSLFIGTLSNFFNTLVNELEMPYLSFEAITIISLLILIISLYISLKIINKEFKVKKNKQFLKISVGLFIVYILFILGNKLTYGNLVHEENYRDMYVKNVEFTVADQEYKDGTISVKIKIRNHTKYTYILEDANLVFEIHENGDKNSYLTSNLKVELPYDWEDEKSDNYKAKIEGIAPNDLAFIEFIIPKGITLDSKYFVLDNMLLEHEGRLVSKLPFLQSGYITINPSETGSTTAGIIALEELNKDKKGE